MTSLETITDDKGPISEPREDIIKTAIKFLQNPHVSKSPLAQSQKFLRSKGLSDQEIQLACERSGAYGIHYFSEQPPSVPPSLPQPLQLQIPQSMFYRIKDTVHTIAIFTSFAYGLYLLYKKYIRPWLFGEKKKKTIEDSMAELSKSVTASIDDLKEGLTEVRSQVDRLSCSQNEGPSMHCQLQDLKNEVSSVKGLLLNRKQFPSVPPSIPAWQLSSVQPEQDTEDNKAEELMEIGSGSGSSETEVVTKNSDSSLEIM